MRWMASVMALLLGACAQGGERMAPDAVVPDVDAGDPGDAGPPPDAPTADTGATPCGTAETCNGADDDCDGEVDEEPTDGTLFYRDGDGDGYGVDASPRSACEAPEGYVATLGDCNDGNALMSPGHTDTCDGLDNDCSGAADEPGCPPGCTPVAFGGHGYLFCAGALDAAAATAACDAAGLRIVRVDTEAENAFLRSTAFAAGGIAEHWIGASVAGGSTEWKWADGTPFWDGVLGGSAIDGLFARWESDQPSGVSAPACARLRDRDAGGWYAVGCGGAAPYACERYPEE